MRNQVAPSASSKIQTVLICTWLPLWSQALTRLLSDFCANIRTVFSAAECEEAIHSDAPPEVIIAAGTPPEKSLANYLGPIVEASGTIPLIVLTHEGEPSRVKEALRLGAKAYLLLDDTTSTSLSSALSAVTEGLLVLGRGPAAAWGPTETSRPAAPEHSNTLGKYGLTPREAKVYHLMARGMCSRDIGERLGITLRTVQMFTAKIVEKLGAQSRTEAAIQAALETFAKTTEYEAWNSQLHSASQSRLPRVRAGTLPPL